MVCEVQSKAHIALAGLFPAPAGMNQGQVARDCLAASLFPAPAGMNRP